MNSQIKDFYRELDLEPGADLSSIRQSYRQLVKVWHPDRFGNDQKLQAVADNKLKKINSAYESLVAFLENGGVGKTATPKSEAPPKTQQAAPATEIYYAGLTKYHARDYKGALELFLQAAEMGNAKAQYAVGYVYHQHRRFVPLFGANKHWADVLRWWTKAAESGHSDAQFMVGTFHQTGFCTPFDLSEARKWFERAAAKGHLEAQHRLKRMGVWNVVNVIPLVNLWVGQAPPGPPPPT